MVLHDDTRIDLTQKKDFKYLFDSFFVTLCAFSEQYVKNKGLAYDIVQDCFVKLWDIRNNFDHVYQVKAFLYKAVRNRSINEVEHTKVEKKFHDFLSKKSNIYNFENRVIEYETIRIVNNAISRLPARTREIMEYALDGCSNNEIAEQLSISEETVHTLKKNAYKKLRDLLKDHYYLFFLLLP